MLKHPWVQQTEKNTAVFFPQEEAEERDCSAIYCAEKKRQLCVTETLTPLSLSLSLCCPAVPPVSDAGKVYDRYCPRDGVPQRQELHPQRPRRSQLHVSTISASTFHSFGSCVLFHLLFLLKRSWKRTKSRAGDWEQLLGEEKPQKG